MVNMPVAIRLIPLTGMGSSNVKVTGDDSTQLIEEFLYYEIKLFAENGNEIVSKDHSKEHKHKKCSYGL